MQIPYQGPYNLVLLSSISSTSLRKTRHVVPALGFLWMALSNYHYPTWPTLLPPLHVNSSGKCKKGLPSSPLIKQQMLPPLTATTPNTYTCVPRLTTLFTTWHTIYISRIFLFFSTEWKPTLGQGLNFFLGC